LNAALNRPAGAPIALPAALPDESIAATDEEILDRLAHANPELLALDHEVARARHAVRLAGQAVFPDIQLGVDYTDVGSPPRPEPLGFKNPAAVRSASRFVQGTGDLIDAYTLGRSFWPGDTPDDSGKDIWMLSVSMNLPIWYGTYAAGEREARARYRAAINTRAQMKNDLTARLAAVLYAYNDAKRKTGLYRDTLIPKAVQAVEATETAYRSGRASFLDLVDVERTLLDFRLACERARTNRAQRVAELDMLVGQTLPRREGQDG
jgi:outer membrane protein TolC